MSYFHFPNLKGASPTKHSTSDPYQSISHIMLTFHSSIPKLKSTQAALYHSCLVDRNPSPQSQVCWIIFYTSAVFLVMLLLCQVEQEIDHSHSWSFPFPSCESSQSYVASCRTHILEALSQLSTLASVECVSPPSPFRSGCCLLIFVPHLRNDGLAFAAGISPQPQPGSHLPLVTTPSLWGLFHSSSGHCTSRHVGSIPASPPSLGTSPPSPTVIQIPLSSQRCFILFTPTDLSLILQESYSCKQQKIQFQLAQKQIYWLRWLKIQTQVWFQIGIDQPKNIDWNRLLVPGPVRTSDIRVSMCFLCPSQMPHGTQTAVASPSQIVYLLAN